MNDKDYFVKILQGRQVPLDIFGRIIKVDDVIVYGSGSQAASALNFGKVTKINYNGKDDNGNERLTSITIQRVVKPNSFRAKRLGIAEDKYIKTKKKQGLLRYGQCMVIDTIPQPIQNALDSDFEIDRV